MPDGSSSDQSSLNYTFNSANQAPEKMTVQLIVTDSVGNTATDELIISLNNTPPQVAIMSINDGDLYPLSDFTYLPLRAEVSDAEHSDEELTYEWQAFLFHNNHNHAGPIENSKESYALLEPVGCTDETYWYRVELTITDPAGLSTKDVVEIFPDCGTPFGTDILLTGTVASDRNVLAWTSENTAIKEYIIQRSENTTDFISIGKVDGQSFGTFGNGRFSFDDPQPLWGKENKYRIMAILTDGRFDYSNKISLEYPGPQRYSLFPNPTDGMLQFQVQESAGNIELQLFDASGKLVFIQSWKDDIMDGLETSISIQGLANGIYYFTINNGLTTFHGNLVKID